MPRQVTPEPVNPFAQGPYVQLAAFCERVLTEADGVVSLIRVVDTITHTERGPNAPPDMPEISYPLVLILSIKSGRARGRHEIEITPELPSGTSLPSVKATVQLEGEEKGATIASQIQMTYKAEGLYWFNIRFDETLLTRIPLQVRYARLVTGSAS